MDSYGMSVLNEDQGTLLEDQPSIKDDYSLAYRCVKMIYLLFEMNLFDLEID